MASWEEAGDSNGSFRADWARLMDADLLALVPQHWLAFRPPPPRHHLALAAAYLPLFFAGLLGNGAIIFLFLT